MTSQTNRPWPGVPCDADGWPYSTDIAVFEARRAVGQYARSHVALTRGSSTDPIGVYLMGTKALAEAIDTVRADLVAEARARGLTWSEIGKFLDGVSGNAVQNRFGDGLTSDRGVQLQEEAEIVSTTNDTATTPVTEPTITDMLDGTPEERFAYVYHLIDGAKAACRRVEEQLRAMPPDLDAIPHYINAVYKKLQILGVVMMGDQAQWSAVDEWTGKPDGADHSHYYSAATYLYLAMRQMVHCCHYFVWMLNREHPDFEAAMDYFVHTTRLLDTVILLLNRGDVQSILPPREERD